MTAVELATDGAVGLDEAVALSGVKRSKLYELMGEGKLAYAKVGSRRLIPRRALTALIAINMVGADGAGIEAASPVEPRSKSRVDKKRRQSMPT